MVPVAAGIAGAGAEAGCRVLLLDVSDEAARKALDRIVNARPAKADIGDLPVTLVF